MQSWLRTLSLTQGMFDMFYSAIYPKDDKCALLEREWRKLRLTQCFVREVSDPLGLPRCMLQLWWRRSDDIGSVPMKAGLRATMLLLMDLNRLWQGEGAEECFICSNVPSEPHQLTCCRQLL